MESSARLPLALRQKLNPFGIVAATAATIGTGVSSTLIANWVWTKAIKPRMKGKDARKKMERMGFVFRIDIEEEHVHRVRKTTIVTVSRLKDKK